MGQVSSFKKFETEKIIANGDTMSLSFAVYLIKFHYKLLHLGFTSIIYNTSGSKIVSCTLPSRCITSAGLCLVDSKPVNFTPCKGLPSPNSFLIC